MRRQGRRPQINRIPGQEFGLAVELEKLPSAAAEPAEAAAAEGCVSDLTGVEWVCIHPDDSIGEGESFGTSVTRYMNANDPQRLIGPFAVAGVPIGDACPDCVYTWSKASGPTVQGFHWSQAGSVLMIYLPISSGGTSPSTVTYGGSTQTFTFTLTVDCPDSGQSGVVGILTFVIELE